MTSLRDFGGGAKPGPDPKETDHDSRGERAKARRRTYRQGDGRCRGVSTSKGCRCGGAALKDAEGLCHYHGQERETSPRGDKPVTLDSSPALLARWCGTRATMWDQLPWQCRVAIEAIESGDANG